MGTEDCVRCANSQGRGRPRRRTSCAMASLRRGCARSLRLGKTFDHVGAASSVVSRYLVAVLQVLGNGLLALGVLLGTGSGCPEAWADVAHPRWGRGS